MCRYLLTCCLVGVLCAVSLVKAEEPQAEAPKQNIRFNILPDREQKHWIAVPVVEQGELPEQSLVVTCSSFRFAEKSIVFIDATLDSAGHRVTTKEATLHLENMDEPNLAWKFSDDFTMTVKKASKE